MQKIPPEQFTLDNLVIKDNVPAYWEWSKTWCFVRIAHCMLIEWWAATVEAMDRPDFPGLTSYCTYGNHPQTWHRWRLELARAIAERYAFKLATLKDERALEVIHGDRYLIACIDIYQDSKGYEPK